ncbi:hypothetical protein GTY67_19040 [Streptomyces sp. SID8374]|uniref:hypothetical protein n=1 Tax=Streptomyces sp. SID8374 TaxID=2690354 RepID=UPI0013690D16|nr:hypothetical protein [Streptomyces sp. SID8374]
MSSSRPVRRPTETTALHNARRPCPPADQVRNLLTVAHATGDRYGARHFGHMFTRALGQTGATR